MTHGAIMSLPTVLLASSLLACAPTKGEPNFIHPPHEIPVVTPAVDSCGAAELQSLVGQPAAVLQTMRFAGPVRILRPGEVVTMDYSSERLNIEIDADEVIVRVACG